MSAMKLIAYSVALSALAGVLGTSSDELVFEARSGSKVEKRFHEVTRFDVQSLVQSVDGKPVPDPGLEVAGAVTRSLRAIDTTRTVERGVALELEREFADVFASVEMSFGSAQGSSEADVKLTSPLEGERVRIARQDRSSACTFQWAEKGKDSTAELEGLRADLDLSAFVSEGGVEEGDAWKLDPADLLDVLAPGGALGFVSATEGMPDGEFLEPADVIAASLCGLADNTGELEGEVLCTWRKTATEGERKLATIEIEWESTSRSDTTAELRRRIAASGAPNYREDLAFLTQWTTSGKGSLVWDLGAKRARALVLELDSKVDCEFKWTQQGANIALEFELAAQTELRAEFEAR
jgi:hypothetical protein